MRLTGFAFVLASLCAPVAAQAADLQSVDDLLLPYLSRYDLPAIAAAVIVDGEVVAAGAVGTRRAGFDLPVTLDDRFHIGSDTKAMTALLGAMLVEEGALRWDVTVGEIYPELAPEMSAAVAGITLEQLLSHQGGIAGDDEAQIPLLAYSVTDERANLDRMRYILVSRLIHLPLKYEPGKGFEYANLGYTLAGSMMERVTGKSWEELVAERIFDPLGLASAGFGPQSSMGRVDAPLGHAYDEDGVLQAFLAGPWGDNPQVIGPAGTAHMSVLDFARWAAWNVSTHAPEPALVSSETLRRLHTPLVDMPPRPDAPVGTPSSGSYALGWLVADLPFGEGKFVTHGGSNNENLAYIMLQPDKGLGFVTMTNIASPEANAALVSVSEALFERFVAP